jgi:hypothetical protein
MPSFNSSTSHRDAVVDVSLVILVVLAYVLAEAAGVGKRWIFFGEAVILVGYAALVWHRGRESWHDFGLRTDIFADCVGPIGTWTLIGILAIVIWAWGRGRPMWRADMIVLLPFYPIYGVVQQLMFQGVLHRRLLALLKSRTAAATITTCAFAAVHFGSWPLVGLTAAVGSVWCYLYQRWPSVWLLGLSHGILAALAYPMILGDQPLQRF